MIAKSEQYALGEAKGYTEGKQVGFEEGRRKGREEARQELFRQGDEAFVRKLQEEKRTAYTASEWNNGSQQTAEKLVGVQVGGGFAVDCAVFFAPSHAQMHLRPLPFSECRKRQVIIGWFHLDADAVPSQPRRGRAACSGPHERVQNRIAHKGKHAYQSFGELMRKGGWMFSGGRASQRPVGRRRDGKMDGLLR